MVHGTVFGSRKKENLKVYGQGYTAKIDLAFLLFVVGSRKCHG